MRNGVFSLALFVSVSTALAQDAGSAFLDDFGVPSDTASLLGYVQAMGSAQSSQTIASRLLDKLGHEDFAVRERATRQLIALPHVPANLLDAAARSSDPEVRLRLQTIQPMRLDTALRGTLDVAVLQAISRRHPPSAVALLVDALARADDDYVRYMATAALVACVDRQHMDFLRQHANSKSDAVRAAVAAALGKTGDAAGDLQRWLCDPSEQVQLAAAQVLAQRTDRACLPVLVRLLESGQWRTRVAAASLLRQLTRQNINYVAYEAPQSQAAAIQQWRLWVQHDGQTATLQAPGNAALPFERGRILVTVFGQGRVTELDDAGNETLSTEVAGPWGCSGLPNGNRLVCSYNDQRIIELDADGETCWTSQELPGNPISVQRLDNGHTLVALADSDKVVQVGRDGRIHWQVSLGGRPVDARRLDDGHTLVTLDHDRRVVEIDASGRQVWAIECQSSPSTAQRIEGGRTLVAERGLGRVVEYDRSGKPVWSAGGLQYPVQAQRLADGSTLVGDSTGIKHLDHKGKLLWHKEMGSARMCRY